MFITDLEEDDQVNECKEATQQCQRVMRVTCDNMEGPQKHSTIQRIQHPCHMALIGWLREQTGVNCKRQESACLVVLDRAWKSLARCRGTIADLGLWWLRFLQSLQCLLWDDEFYFIYETFLNINLKTEPKVDMAKHG